MRSRLVTGLSILSITATAAIATVGSVVGQTSTVRVVATPPGAPHARFVIEKQLQAVDEPSEEMARLNAQDAQLGHEAESLAKQLADADDEKQRAEIKDKLHETLAQQFDAQQKVRELEVGRIEAKVKKLRATISKRNDARRTVIDKRFDQLLSEAEGLGWNSPAVGPGHGAVYAPRMSGSGGFQTSGGTSATPVPIVTAPGKR